MVEEGARGMAFVEAACGSHAEGGRWPGSLRFKKCARFQQGAMLAAPQLLEGVSGFTSKARLSASVD